MKPFLLVFNDVGAVNRQVILNFLDTRPLEIKNWYSCFTNGILIISEKNVTELDRLIHSQFPLIWFAIAEVKPETISGWTPKVFWDFISHPRSSK